MTEVVEGTSVSEELANELRGALRGAVLQAGDPAYDTRDGRLVWNADIDKHPALVARCVSVADVMACVKWARRHDVRVAVRCAGHNISGSSTTDGGLLIDLGPMKGVRVDPRARTVRAQGGCTWGDVDHATSAFGLANTGGVNSITGISGLTLGGGIGWLMRKHGLACDNLIAADVVTADGKFLTVGEDENPDLLWGLRGGGGNFGIVTEFEYRVYPVSEVQTATLMWPAEQAREVLQLYREFSATEPEELTTFLFLLDAPAGPFLPAELHGKPLIAIAGCYLGSTEEARKAFGPLFDFGPPLTGEVAPTAYTSLQSSSDLDWMGGYGRYWKSDYLDELPDEAIDVILRHCDVYPRPTMPPRDIESLVAQPTLYFELGHMEGAISSYGTDYSAVGHRDAAFLHVICTVWSDPADREEQVEWARAFWTELLPYTAGGGYVNYLGIEGDERVLGSYGSELYNRLEALKAKYDPTNFFASNQNIRPATD